jgi:glycosyltransferase involved in cell wall biosynthesis
LLADWLRRERVELLHAHQYGPFFYATLARLLYRRPPVLFTEHGRHAPDYRRPKRVFANRMLLEGRDRVVGVGEAVRQALIDNEGIPPRRVGVIYNGVDLSPFATCGDDRRAVRRELGVSGDELVLVQVARLDYLKDHGTALRTVAAAVSRRPDLRLLLVGTGPEQGAIQALVHQYKLERNVRLLGLRTDVARLLSGADVFLLTSISEGIPLTVIEAMAAGLPVVSTGVGGVPEVVADGHSGLLAPAGDHDALAARVCELAADAARRQEMGRRGRARAQAFFAEELMLRRYDRLYREMLRD